MKLSARYLASCCTLLCGFSHAQANFANDEKLSPVSRDLYLEAMQAISEGRKKDASRLLEHMKEAEPQHAGAWLDLALIQCELGNGNEAERLFQDIEKRFRPPPEIMQIIHFRRSIGCKKTVAPSQWSIALARGYEQNVNQGASNPNLTVRDENVITEISLTPEFFPKGDHYTLLAGDYVREMNQNGGLLFSQFQWHKNDTLGKFDSSATFIGLEQPFRVGNWTFRGSSMLGVITLGGRLYQKQWQVQGKVNPPLNLPKGLSFQLSASLNHLRYATLTNFDANTAELRGQLQYKSRNVLGTASLAFLNDHATGDRPGGRRHGWLAHINSRTQLQYGIQGEFGWTRQTWQGNTPYFAKPLDQVRVQTTQTWRAALIYPWRDQQVVQLEFRQVSNKENISIFQYNNRQIQLSWMWQNR